MKKTQPNPDIAGLVIAVQHQISSLERKVDLLISKASGQPPAFQHTVKTFQPAVERQAHQPLSQHPQQPQPRPTGKEPQKFNRILHKAICADCKKECEVPFKPSQDRPVYCKGCFSARKKNGTFNIRPAVQAPQPERPAKPEKRDEPQTKARPKKRPQDKSRQAKRPAAKKKKRG